MRACDLPEDVAAGFEKITRSLAGVKYMPVLYVGTQVGTGNHMLICQQTLTIQPTPDEPEHLAEFIINSSPSTGEWSLVSIIKIV